MTSTKTWREPLEIAPSDALRAAVGGHPLVAATLERRAYTTPERALAFLDPALYTPASPYDLPDMDRAVARLEEAIARDEHIVVWGDFDVDGQTATALLVSALEALGANVGYHVPVRESEGHGVNVTWLERVIDAGASLILTCDTGVSAHDAVAYAQERGVAFVITDHHELTDALPGAAAVVNPRRLPEGHPLSHLPGVGVAYKVAEALYGNAGRAADAERFLDLAALGIVADVATQIADTRYLLQRGIEALRHTERPGLREMMKLAGMSPEGLTEEHIGYILAPRLNAVGRLADAQAGVELLTTGDLARARILAGQLEALNAQRRRMCDEVYAAAQTQIAQNPRLLDDAALVLAHPSWPAGIIGIVASRLVEQYERPVVLLSAPPDGPARGSARSVVGVNITRAIAGQADLLTGFGGHPMAAGVTLPPDNLPAFRRGLARTVASMIGGAPEPPSLEIDAYVTLDEVTPELATELGRLAPFGPGNPPVTLAALGLVVSTSRRVGRGDEHRIVEVEDATGAARRVIWWEGGAAEPPAGAFDLAFVLRASDYRGAPQVEVEWLDARQEVSAAAEPEPLGYEIVDLRAGPPDADRLPESADPAVAVWREAEAKGLATGADRFSLPAADTLVIWTTPPGPAELRAALSRVRPQRVILIAADPEAGGRDRFLRRLAGLAKYAIGRRDGLAAVAELAAATAQREATVRQGLAWLEAHGDLSISELEDGRLLLAGGGAPRSGLADITARLDALLAETAAYRAHFRRAPADRLLPERV